MQQLLSGGEMSMVFRGGVGIEIATQESDCESVVSADGPQRLRDPGTIPDEIGEEGETNGEDRTGDGQLVDGLSQKVALGQSEVREVVRERPLRLTEAQENLMRMSRLERLQTEDVAEGEEGNLKGGE